ncbi:hypothetical protein PG988_003317 [Apiospora saccharicola]
MASTLPNELLLQILKDTLPYDFESLALTFKHMYALASPLLARHNELRRKYRRFEWPQGDRHDSDNNMCVPELLLEIATDPIIARYIIHADLVYRRTLRVNFAEHPMPMDDAGRSAHYRNITPRAKLLALVNESHYIPLHRLSAEGWVDRIIADRCGPGPGYAVAFSLSLLPNLESLVLDKTWSALPERNFTGPETTRSGTENTGDDWERAVPDLLHLLITRANDVGGLETDQDCPLRKLRTLHPIQDYKTWPSEINLEAIVPFFALNSLQKVRMDRGVLGSVAWVKAEDDKFGTDDDWKQYWKTDEGAHERPLLNFQKTGKYVKLGPNLEVLDLRDSVVSDEAALPLVKYMHRSRVLKLEYNDMHYHGQGWNVNYFLQNVAEPVGQHLEHLAITARGLVQHQATLFWKDANRLKNLHRFRALTRLTLDSKLFVDSSADLKSPPTPVEDVAEHVTSLLDVAPRTLEMFVLHVSGTAEDRAVMEILFRDFAGRRGERLPDLAQAEVVVDGCDLLGWELKDWTEQYEIARFCMAKGIECTMVRCHVEAMKKCEDNGVAFKQRDYEDTR